MYDGSRTRWDEQIRLRHLGSGRLLTVVTPPGWGAPSEAGTDRSGRALESQRGAGTTVKLLSGAVAPLRDSNVSARSQEQPAQPQDVNLKVVLADEDRIEPEDAAFGLEPQYPDDDGHLSFNKSFRLYHIKTGCYLHFDADAAVNWQEEEAAAKERASSAYADPHPPGSLQSRMSRGPSLGGIASIVASREAREALAVEDESDTPRVPLVACTRKSDEDVFGLLQARISAQFRAQLGAIL